MNMPLLNVSPIYIECCVMTDESCHPALPYPTLHYPTLPYTVKM